MDLTITLRDNEEDVDSFHFQFDNETRLQQLMEKISSNFNIDENYQRLRLDGKNLTSEYGQNVALSTIGLRDGDKIVINHSHLNIWIALNINDKNFKETPFEDLKKSLYVIGKDFIKALEASNFYGTYPKYLAKAYKIHKTLASYYDRTRGAIENSSKIYFKNLHGQSNIEITFCSRLEGTRRGVICSVYKNNEIFKYYIKTHHGGGARDSHTREDLDLKELFAYKFLERLGVGAEIHFIPNEHCSRWILYIGSREIIGFKTMKEIESDENLDNYTTPVVEILTLYTILNMGDHHVLNMGLDERNSPYIVDFFLIPRDSIDINKNFYDKVRGADRIKFFKFIVMDLTITLRDNEEDVDSFHFQFDNETRLQQLMEKISSNFNIDENYQRLCLDGKNLTSEYGQNVALSTIGLRDGDKIVINHSHLNIWIALNNNDKNFKETPFKELKKNLYETGNKLIKFLQASDFYIAYPKYIDKAYKIQKTLASHYDRTRGTIENSSKIYFKNLHGQSNIEITFCSRLEGTRRGVICSVHKNNEIFKYYIKTHHGGGARDSHTREDLDLKELFAYKFLERLGVGAEIHFIPNEHCSRWILYIGSREIIGFKTMKEIESDENLDNYTTPVVEILTLYTILNMGDHHVLNMGLDERNSPYIVDFFLIPRDSIDINKNFYDKVRGADRINEVLGSFVERVRIAKEFLQRADFETQVDDALKTFLVELKTMFDERHLAFKDDTKTEDLKLYVEKIKQNALKFHEFQL